MVLSHLFFKIHVPKAQKSQGQGLANEVLWYIMVAYTCCVVGISIVYTIIVGFRESSSCKVERMRDATMEDDH